MAFLKYYLNPALDTSKLHSKFEVIRGVSDKITNIQTEYCFYIKPADNKSIELEDLSLLKWILGFPGNNICDQSLYKTDKLVIEIGPRLNISTPFSTNAVSICNAVGLSIKRIERSIRYIFMLRKNFTLEPDEEEKIECLLLDRMTEVRYNPPLENFHFEHQIKSWYKVDIQKENKAAILKVNTDLGLSMDSWDIDYYYRLFSEEIKRNPTSVECFDLAQSNSEHSRHWFFKGNLIIDSHQLPKSLFDMLKHTQTTSNDNSVIAFSDNSSAIQGFTAHYMTASRAGVACPFEKTLSKRHITLTAETHNFPTGVSPFCGATTGTGGRIRDNQAVGRGGHVMAAVVGYSFGNLFVANYQLPWEEVNIRKDNNRTEDEADWQHPLAVPLQVIIGASNGASDYGNKFGEPVLAGWARSFGQTVASQRREWIKVTFQANIY